MLLCCSRQARWRKRHADPHTLRGCATHAIRAIRYAAESCYADDTEAARRGVYAGRLRQVDDARSAMARAAGAERYLQSVSILARYDAAVCSPPLFR